MNGIELRQRRVSLKLSQAKMAELTALPQHLLSAFELQKVDLPETSLHRIRMALHDTAKVHSVVKRAKRFRRHECVTVERITSRVNQAARTARNAEYLETLDVLWRECVRSKKPFSAVSLFSGCGGFSLGFSAAGFDVKGFLEKESGARNIYQLNFENSKSLGEDICDVTADDLAAIADEIGIIDVLIGGPPCQGFSLAGKRDASDPRNTLFEHYMRFLEHLRPKFAVIENVRLLTSMKNADGALVQDAILSRFNECDYDVKLFEINAKDYGVPQHRERVFFLASRKDLALPPSIPEKLLVEIALFLGSHCPIAPSAMPALT